MVNQLPTLAIWVLVGFWCYKVVCVGSIYGIIRLAINKLHSWKTSPRDYKIKTRVADEETLHQLEIEIARIGGKYQRIWESDVLWLREAINDKVAKEQQEKDKDHSLTRVGRP